LIDKAHGRGIVWLQTVGDVEGAEAALEAGADVLIAQGTEADAFAALACAQYPDGLVNCGTNFSINRVAELTPPARPT
jgi:hypothetical protein